MAVLGGDGKGVSEYPDAALIPQYEKAVVDAYGQAGLTVTWIDADQTVQFQGSIHCLTQQIGRVPNH
jgi:agmatine/peptidylarginine deiminase